MPGPASPIGKASAYEASDPRSNLMKVPLGCGEFNYNSEIWNLQHLNCDLKQRLMSTSTNAIRICTPFYQDRMS